MTMTREDPTLAQPLENPDQLLEFFRHGEKPPARWKLGTEHEKLGLYSDTLEPVPYEGERGIGALFEVLRRDHGFSPLLDEGKLLGLERDGTSITLEPGGQLELSGAPLSTLHETCKEFNDHIALLKHVSEPFRIVWLGLGVRPIAPIERTPKMPRGRYAIMREYLGKRDELGLHMMHATAGVQANFDFESEADAADKLRVGLAASPISTALWANSSISEGEPNGYESQRAWVWRKTDPDRCGFLPFAFEKGWGEGTVYSRYTEWALDVPMYFIVREGTHLPTRGLTFRHFMAEGFEGHSAILADWNVHLTTLFPEVRLKRVIETRGTDAVPPGLVCALPAFWKGLFYDAGSLAAARQRLDNWTFEEVDALHAEVARVGLKAQAPDGLVAAVARELVDISAAGLKRLGAKSRSGEDESLFLEPIYAILDRGTSPGRNLLDRWEGSWKRRIELLVEYARY
ncbi:MAG: glutamate--cysteine ligase [bacterium]|nr:glutamate--cysteine ligase [bacterium]